MIRFTSFKNDPGETRTLLRERMRQHLRAGRTFRWSPDSNLVTDEAMLKLLLGLRIEWDSEVERAKASYEAMRPAEEPPFDELINKGWLQVFWGRVWAPREFVLSLKTTTTLTALRDLILRRHRETHTYDATIKGDPELSEKLEEFLAKSLELNDLNCLRPEWVAARLWEKRDAKIPVSQQLQDWSDRWSTLGKPEFVIGRSWSAGDSDAFRTGALSVLEADAGLQTWAQILGVAMQRAAMPRNVKPESYANLFGPVPYSLVGRAQWLGQQRLEPVFHELLETNALGLGRLLWLEVADQPLGQGPAPRAVTLFELAEKYPAILAGLSTAVHWDPVLLADLSLYPPTAALACLWIAQWMPPASAWNQPLTSVDDTAGKATAFADGVWFLGEFLKDGRSSPSEAADLLIWFHQTADAGYVDEPTRTEALLAAFRDILTQQSRQTAAKIADAIVDRLMHDPNVTSPAFAAALDMIGLADLVSVVDPQPVLDAYHTALDKSDYALSARRIGTVAAAALYRLADRACEAKRNFLEPFDVKARLARLPDDKTNPYTLEDEIGRALRTHIRVLSRAISGLGEVIPDDLADALAATVHAAALSHKEKGRIGAFAPRFELSPIKTNATDRPLAADLAMALRALPEVGSQKLLDAILQTDEPLLLAQLCKSAPHGYRAAIRARIAAIGPADAGETRSLPEVQARINALLAAREADAASRFIDAEADVQTLGKVGGRDLQRLQWRLQLKYTKGDWDGLLAEPEPIMVSPGDEPAARNAVEFFRAIATLLKDGGDPEAAAEMFRALYERQHRFAYASNLFAAEISIILAGEAFPILHGARERRARDAISTLDQQTAETPPPAVSELETVALNRAILLLGLNQAEEAFATLATVTGEDRQDAASAFRAVALARMGRDAEAKAALENAKAVYGPTAAILQAEAVLGHQSVLAPPVFIDLGEDRREQIKAAVMGFRLMDPPAQADVLASGEDPMRGFMTDTVRAAAASLVGLVPIYAGAADPPIEDDYNSILAQLLANRIEFLNWSIRDFPRAGYSAKGNPGEPDIMVMKGSSTLAAIEGLISNGAVHTATEQKNLKAHFLKLLGYTTARLFFHLTYATTDVLDPIVTYLETCMREPPADFTFNGHEPIAFTDSRPRGITAHYCRNGEDVKVIFLVLNISQATQRGAAKAAEVVRTALAKGGRKSRKSESSL